MLSEESNLPSPTSLASTSPPSNDEEDEEQQQERTGRKRKWHQRDQDDTSGDMDLHSDHAEVETERDEQSTSPRTTTVTMTSPSRTSSPKPAGKAETWHSTSRGTTPALVCTSSDPMPGCGSLLFDRPCEYRKHMDRHERPHRCLEPACVELRGFTYAGGLLRHQREVHNMAGGVKEILHCPFPNCKRHIGAGFSRKENLKEHLRRLHGLTKDNDVNPTTNPVKIVSSPTAVPTTLLPSLLPEVHPKAGAAAKPATLPASAVFPADEISRSMESEYARSKSQGDLLSGQKRQSRRGRPAKQAVVVNSNQRSPTEDKTAAMTLIEQLKAQSPIQRDVVGELETLRGRNRMQSVELARLQSRIAVLEAALHALTSPSHPGSYSAPHEFDMHRKME